MPPVDFSDFLLDYTQNFLLRTSDVANLLMTIMVILTALFAIIISQSTIPISEKIWLIVVSSLIIIGIAYFLLTNKLKKNSNNISEIEKTIFTNYYFINNKSMDEKARILKEFKMVFMTKEKKLKDLIKLLSESGKD